MPGTFDKTAFEQGSLTEAINVQPLQPGVRDLIKPHEAPIATTELRIEYDNGRVDLIPNSPRGAPAVPHQRGARSILQLTTAHFVTRDTIHADELQNLRPFGSDGLEQPNAVRDKRLGEMAANLNQSVEHQRVGAVKGVVTDSTGSILVDLFAEFGVTQQVQSLSLGTTTTHVPNLIVAAKRKAELALGFRPPAWLCLAAPDFLDALRAHGSLERSVTGWEAATQISRDVRFDLSVAGVDVREVMSPEAGPVYIAAGEAYLVPIGVPDLFITRFAPADWMEAANSPGLPLYAKAEPGPMNRWWAIEAQTNPLTVCTRPRAIVKLLTT